MSQVSGGYGEPSGGESHLQRLADLVLRVAEVVTDDAVDDLLLQLSRECLSALDVRHDPLPSSGVEPSMPAGGGVKRSEPLGFGRRPAD